MSKNRNEYDERIPLTDDTSGSGTQVLRRLECACNTVRGCLNIAFDVSGLTVPPEGNTLIFFKGQIYECVYYESIKRELKTRPI